MNTKLQSAKAKPRKARKPQGDQPSMVGFNPNLKKGTGMYPNITYQSPTGSPVGGKIKNNIA